MGKPTQPGPEEMVTEFQKTSNLNAGKSKPNDQGLKRISNLTGEVYNKESDPQELTDVQRTWLYGEDPAVRVVNEGKVTSQVYPYDNGGSLPLGGGYHELYAFKDEPGAFRKKRTEITVQMNQPITKK